MPTNYKKEVLIRGLKMIDIGYITIIYFFVGIFLAKMCDNYLGKFDEKKEEKKTLLKKTLEIIGLLWFYGVVIYIVRNLVEVIPSPVNGIGGFDHLLVKELKNATVFTLIFLSFQNHFQEKIKYYVKNFSKSL